MTKKALFFSFLAGFLVFAGATGLYVGATKSSALETMHQRLNEPVISEAQLYGYEIVGKHVEEYSSSDDTLYFIDIRDILTNKKILKHIKVSKQLFERIEIGNGFDWSLMGKLKVPELEIPEPNSPQPKARE